ncbi:DUF4440 domain-containing protein [Algoriphagus lacus]|nr:DUF4440 domain-containing protein [Algoriphagus lacus]
MKSIRLTLCLILIQFAAFAQNSVSSDEKAVQDLIQNSFDAIFSEFDANQLGDFYTSDFILLEHGELWDMEFIRGYLSRAKQNQNRPTRTNRFEFIQTVIEGNRAWVAYHNYATITQNGQVVRELYWLESATAIRTDKGWRLDMLHSTRVDKK